MNHQELIEKLKLEEETIVLELLDIKSEELVDAFLDLIEERLEYINRHYA